MEFGRILTRAWEITWRWKVLWILGFLAGLANGSSSADTARRFVTDRAGNIFPNIDFPSYLSPLLAGLACVSVIIGIVLWVLSVMARGGLIAGVMQVEDTGTTSLGRAWAMGQTRFWTLFGIGVLTFLPIIILVLVAVVAAIATLAPAYAVTSSGGGSAGGGPAALVAGLAICLCGCICGVAIVALALGQVRIYAERAAILEGLNWTAAFARGWQVLRDHLGPTLVLWLIFIVLGLIFAALTAIILSPILIPLGLIGGQAQFPNALWPALCGGGLIALIVGAVINVVVQVFTSAAWTLAYRALTGVAPLPPAAAPPAPAPPMLGE